MVSNLLCDKNYNIFDGRMNIVQNIFISEIVWCKHLR